MELTAVVEALRLGVSPQSPVDLDALDKVAIWTDSRYVHAASVRPLLDREDSPCGAA